VHPVIAAYPADYAGVWMASEVAVDVEVEVGHDGTVSHVEVLQGADDLVESARSAAQKYQFRPFEQAGSPVVVRAGLRIRFPANNGIDVAGKSMQDILASPGDLSVRNLNAGSIAKSGLGTSRGSALPFYLEASRLRPDWYLPHLWLAEIYNATGEDNKALEHINAVCRLRPDLSVGHLRRGWTLKRLGRAEEASSAFLEAKRTAMTADAVVTACENLLNTVEEPAADSVSRSIELERLCNRSRMSAYKRWQLTNTAQEAYWFAQGCRSYADDMSATAAYRIAVGIGGDDYYVLMSRVELAAMLMSKGEADASASQLQEVLATIEKARVAYGKGWDDHQQSAYHFWKGVVHTERGELLEAMQELERSVRVNKQANCSYAELGILKLRAGDWSGGVDALRKSGLVEKSALEHIRTSKKVPNWPRGDRNRPSCATAPLRLRF
jgi:tetratricopeptide (TPR) repeat protein